LENNRFLIEEQVYLVSLWTAEFCFALFMVIPFFSFPPQHEPIRTQVLAEIADVYAKQWYIKGAGQCF